MKMSEKNWIICILLGWTFILGWANIYKLFPTSYCFEVNKVHVSNSVIGVSPKLKVERVIHHLFDANWYVEVGKKLDDGYEFWCNSSGQNEYSPRDRLPSNLDLDWWTFPKRCLLTPGVYRVVTVWQLQIAPNDTRHVRNVSNDFVVSSRIE